MGRARRDASPISFEAAARPDRRCSGRGSALASVGPRRLDRCARASRRPCDDRGGLQRQMERPEAARAAPDRNPRGRAGRPGGRGAGDRFGAARGDRDSRTDGSAGHARTGCSPPACRRLLKRWGIDADDSAGGRLSQTAGRHFAARHRRRGRGAVGAGAAAGPAQAPAGWRRGRGAARMARSGSRRSTWLCAGRGRAPASAASTIISRRRMQTGGSAAASPPGSKCGRWWPRSKPSCRRPRRWANSQASCPPRPAANGRCRMARARRANGGGADRRASGRSRGNGVAS